MNYCPEPDNHVRDKFKIVLQLSNYATKKEIKHATGAGTSDLAAKKILLLWRLKLINETLINWLMFQLA